MSQDDGGPAFPTPHYQDSIEGMSLRDWFAGQALAGLSAKHGTVLGDDGEWVAMQAYAYADAMIEERSKK